MNFMSIAIRVVFAYVFLLCLVRLSGKQTISEGTPFDFVIALILGDLIDDLFWAEIPAMQFVVAASFLIFMHVLTTIGAFNSKTFAQLVQGKPCDLIRNGEFNRKTQKRERLPDKEVLGEIRRFEVGDLREVEVACTEPSDTIAVIRKKWAQPAQKMDLEKLRKLRS